MQNFPFLLYKTLLQNLLQKRISIILHFSTAIPQTNCPRSTVSETVLQWAFSVITFSGLRCVVGSEIMVPRTEEDRKKSFAKRRASGASESFARLVVRRLVLLVLVEQGVRNCPVSTPLLPAPLYASFPLISSLAFPSRADHPGVP